MSIYTIVFIIVVLLALYSSFYYIFSDEITIYQTDLSHFDINMLYKKQPIIIENITTIDELLSLFTTNIVEKNININSLWNKNRYKYLLIYSSSAEVSISHPYSKYEENVIPEQNTSLTTIKLKNKVLIIPFNWRYHIEGQSYIYGVNDYITYILSLF